MGILEVPSDDECILITLPSFNELLSGVSINYPKSEFQGPLFENQCANLLDSEAFSVDGIFLGSVKWLQERFNEMIESKPTGE
jgi:hypothetical protein